jgi:hypothetical protein
LVIPFIADRYRENKQRKYVGEQMTTIDSKLGIPYQNRAEYQNRIDNLRKKIQEIYARGKISESHYETLNNKISQYEEKASEV